MYPLVRACQENSRRIGEDMALATRDLPPSTRDLPPSTRDLPPSKAYQPSEERASMSHWTAGRFCNNCPDGAPGQHESPSPSCSIRSARPSCCTFRRQVFGQRLPLAAGCTACRKFSSKSRARQSCDYIRRSWPVGQCARQSPIRHQSDNRIPKKIGRRRS